MPCFGSTNASRRIKSDCRKKATPFQMERPINQSARLIAFQSVACQPRHDHMQCRCPQTTSAMTITPSPTSPISPVKTSIAINTAPQYKPSSPRRSPTMRSKILGCCETLRDSKNAQTRLVTTALADGRIITDASVDKSKLETQHK